MQVLPYLVVLGSAIWIAVDAGRLGARRGALGGGMLDMGPVGWFFATLLLWIVAFPCYLATRPRLARRARALALHQPQRMAPMPGTYDKTPDAHFGVADPSVPSHSHATPQMSAPQLSPQPSTPPPGWYPSPYGSGLTWWDGANWTDHQTEPNPWT